MKIARFSDAADGGSRFDDVEVAFADSYVDRLGSTHPRTRSFTADGRIVEFAAGLSMDWHGAPNRRVIVILSGTLEVETTDGEVRRFRPGDVAIAADVGGKGHRTRVVEGPAHLLFLEVAAGTAPDVFGA